MLVGARQVRPQPDLPLFDIGQKRQRIGRQSLLAVADQQPQRVGAHQRQLGIQIVFAKCGGLKHQCGSLSLSHDVDSKAPAGGLLKIRFLSISSDPV